MPIFEYQCKSCEGLFELLVRSDTVVQCPECGSGDVSKRLSLFASRVKQGAGESPSCFTGRAGCDLGKCGSGLCGVE
jgi:putative FmdB family regulatory protein